MSKKIILKSNLSSLKKKYRKLKKKIVLVHGVFDVIHLGHTSHFEDAKSYGDILVVSLTPDQYVKKGFNKPYFSDQDRAKYLSFLEIVDHIVINNNKSSINIIKALKPHFYCKGPDYAKKSGDIAGNLEVERNEVEKNGGKLIITKGRLYSSTKILNNYFEDFNLGKNKIDEIFKNKEEKESIVTELNKVFKKAYNEKILVIGEIILDEYRYSTPLGTPSKENILSVKYEKKQTFLGGTVPVVNTISEISNDVTFVSLFKNKNIKKKVSNSLNKNIKLKLINEKKYKDIFKTRFIDLNKKQKFFEFYDFNNIAYNNNQLIKYLNKNLSKFDKVVVCDFGHGLFNTQIVNLIQKKSKYICANIQTNSGNRGFNLFTKYSKLDLLCVDEPELRLGLKEKFLKVDKLIKSNLLRNYKNVVVTRSINGLIVHLNNSSTNILKFPALNTKVVDTMGAGDAVYAYCAALIKNTNNKKIISMIGSIAGAIKTNILGHSKNITLNDVRRSFETILK